MISPIVKRFMKLNDRMLNITAGYLICGKKVTGENLNKAKELEIWLNKKYREHEKELNI